jgi:hypothetical protein
MSRLKAGWQRNMTKTFYVKRIYEMYFLRQTRELVNTLMIPNCPCTNLLCCRRVILTANGKTIVGLLIGKDASRPLMTPNAIVLVNYTYRILDIDGRPNMIALVKWYKPGHKSEIDAEAQLMAEEEDKFENEEY